jgi:hypothetical protein
LDASFTDFRLLLSPGKREEREEIVDSGISDAAIRSEADETDVHRVGEKKVLLMDNLEGAVVIDVVEDMVVVTEEGVEAVVGVRPGVMAAADLFLDKGVFAAGATGCFTPGVKAQSSRSGSK